MQDNSILSLRSIYKKFPGTLALENVDLDIIKGEIHALLGENGAGKSTLIKIISGVHLPSEGEVFFEGKQVCLDSPRSAIDLGIATVPQELDLVPTLDAVENILLHKLTNYKHHMLYSWTLASNEAIKILDEIGVTLNLKVPIRELSIAQQQLVAIARALVLRAKILILDEPTTALSGKEVKELLKIIKELSQKGTTILYISHRLEEVIEIADRVTVLRDAKKIVTMSKSEVTKDKIVDHMIGKKRSVVLDRAQTENNELLSANFSCPGTFDSFSFVLKKGEVLGITGPVGCGSFDVGKALFGLKKFTGKIVLDNNKYIVKSPKEAIKKGVAFVPDDRRAHGIIGKLPISLDINLARYNIKNYGIILNGREELVQTDNIIKALSIKSQSTSIPTKYLSGGNQQKVLLGRWIACNFKVIILCEPTRGVDVEAKAEIHNIILNLSQKGIGIIVISSEIDEILTLCHRVIIMHKGRISYESDETETLTKEKLTKLILGGASN